MRFIDVSMALVLSLASGQAQDVRPENDRPHVRLRLVSEVDAVVPGRTLTIALSLEHAPAWHTYWKNPGTVGMATKIEWVLPEGFTAGPLRWQQPQLTKMAAYTVWGYEGDALLLTDIAVPAALTATDKIEFAAKVTYLACAKICRPGHTKLSLTLPRRAKAEPIAKWRPRFDAVRRQQPERLDDVWQVCATRRGYTYMLTLTPKVGANPDIRALYFFGHDRLVSSNAPQRLRRDGRRVVLTLQREKFTPGDGSRLRGLLHCATGFRKSGTVTALFVDVSLGRSARQR